MRKTKEQKRLRRRKHIRKTVVGTADKPRVYVFKSNKYLHTAFTDDRSGKVLGGAKSARNSKGAEELGKTIADLMKKAKVKEAIFDRSGYSYHGIIAKYAESLRKNGVKI
jgi:large subunit ribosomal protein L18